ncbi:MAG: hypothetical protein KDD45_01595 [Bdellovibrionales bacterium]|nr:hypothetical protein [Bdellovibrionales bacterium]
MEWVNSNFNDYNKIQTINIDMSTHSGDKTWYLELECRGQREEVKFVFSEKSEENKSDKDRSVLSFNLDWPDYLIFLMAVVFAVTIYIQNSNNQKSKTF